MLCAQVADLNLDGRLELLVGTYGGQVLVYRIESSADGSICTTPKSNSAGPVSPLSGAISPGSQGSSVSRSELDRQKAAASRSNSMENVPALVDREFPSATATSVTRSKNLLAGGTGALASLLSGVTGGALSGGGSTSSPKGSVAIHIQRGPGSLAPTQETETEALAIPCASHAVSSGGECPPI